MYLKRFHQQCIYFTKSFFGLLHCGFTFHHNLNIDVHFCFLLLEVTSAEYNILVSSMVRQISVVCLFVCFNLQRNIFIFNRNGINSLKIKNKKNRQKKLLYIIPLITLSWWTESVTVPPTGNSEYSLSLQCLLHLFVQFYVHTEIPQTHTKYYACLYVFQNTLIFCLNQWYSSTCL